MPSTVFFSANIKGCAAHKDLNLGAKSPTPNSPRQTAMPSSCSSRFGRARDNSRGRASDHPGSPGRMPRSSIRSWKRKKKLNRPKTRLLLMALTGMSPEAVNQLCDDELEEVANIAVQREQRRR